MDFLGAITKPFSRPAGYVSAKDEAAAAAKAAVAPAPAPAAPQIGGVNMTAMQRREKAAGLANGGTVRRGAYRGGGMVRGPGTGTSDSVPAEVPVGTFVMPADSTAKVRLSNGEFKVPPEVVAAAGAAALRTVLEATHTPVAAKPQGKANGGAVRAGAKRKNCANGGLVEDPAAPTLAAAAPTTAPATAGVAPVNPAPSSYQADLDARNAATSASSFVNREKGYGAYAPPPTQPAQPAVPTAAKAPALSTSPVNGYEADLAKRNASVTSMFAAPTDQPRYGARRRGFANGGTVTEEDAYRAAAMQISAPTPAAAAAPDAAEAARQARVAQIPASAPTPIPAAPAPTPGAVALPADVTASTAGAGRGTGKGAYSQAPVNPDASAPPDTATMGAGGSPAVPGQVTVTRDPTTGTRTFSGTNVSGDVTYAGDPSFKPSGAGVSVVPGAGAVGGTGGAGGADGRLAAARQAALARGDIGSLAASYNHDFAGGPPKPGSVEEMVMNVAARGQTLSPEGFGVVNRSKAVDAEIQNRQGELRLGARKLALDSQREDRRAVNEDAREGREQELGAMRLKLLEKEYRAGEKPPAGYRAKADGGLEFIPGGPADPSAARRAQPTEDERKAAGWLSQATKGFADMRAAVQTDAKANQPGVIESIPGLPEAAKNASRSEARQRFNQGASALSEAVLRAATGAGVNRDEALQKVAELTPQLYDGPDVIAQKEASARNYLASLSVRAGRAGPEAAAPAPGTAPSGMRQIGTSGGKPVYADAQGNRFVGG